MYKLMQETGQQSESETEENTSLAEFLGARFTGKTQVSLGEIIKVLQDDDGWCDWWKYHQEAWENAGWKKDQLIFVEDFPLLFSNHGDLPSAPFYQYQIDAPETNAAKINTTGEYQWFPCVSVTSNVIKQNAELWQALYNRLNDCSLITDYFKLLPLETWHMTLVSLYVPKVLPDSQAAWQQEMHQKLDIKKIQHKLTEEKFEPGIVIKNSYAGGILLVQVEMDEVSANSVQNLSKALLGKTCDNESHISFAYQYKSASLTTLKAIEETWESIVHELFKDRKLTLDGPKICYFQRMDLVHDSFNAFEIEEQKFSYQTGP